MTKKEFIELCDYHPYTYHGNRESAVGAIFFNKGKNGFKYCVYGRICLTGKKMLIDTLWKFLQGKIEDTPYYIQLIIAPTEEHQFKVPLQASGLSGLLTQNAKRYEKVV